MSDKGDDDDGDEIPISPEEAKEITEYFKQREAALRRVNISCDLCGRKIVLPGTAWLIYFRDDDTWDTFHASCYNKCRFDPFPRPDI